MIGLRAYARHRAAKSLPGQTLAAVQKALAHGRIQAQDGQIDPVVADRAWRNNTNQAMQRGRRDPAPAGSDFDRGCQGVAQHLATSARREWPAFIVGLEFGMYPEKDRILAKACLTTLLPYLVEAWLEEYLDPDRLPEIDWRVFGKDAEAIRVECDALRAEWSSGAQGT